MRTTKLERLKKDLEDTKKEIRLMEQTKTKSEILKRVIPVQIVMQKIKAGSLTSKIIGIETGQKPDFKFTMDNKVWASRRFKKNA